ncbi:hypothetical protein PIB30_099639 [Stylosanthes scabra]|uniref:Peptidase A1 domain-containing protein n=1 Tax=Stylosanthes scabra TaxID=79078 RepID=A0ABU6VYT0_9FABA|nr:hypothetical protein [Stylosanthes scabra]
MAESFLPLSYSYHCMYKNQTTWIQQEIYQAEVSGLMDLIVNSLLYSNKKDSKDAGGDNNLIGQFGVGFYYAFLVSDKPIHGIGIAFDSVPKIEKNSHSASPITLVTVTDHQPPPPFSIVTLLHHTVAAPRPSHLIPSPSPSQEPSPRSPSSSQKS